MLKSAHTFLIFSHAYPFSCLTCISFTMVPIGLSSLNPFCKLLSVNVAAQCFKEGLEIVS